MAIRGEKLWQDLRIGQPDCGSCHQHFFLGAVNLSNSVELVEKVAAYDLSWMHACRVYQVSPTGCTMI
jgi:hypothetical protein